MIFDVFHGVRGAISVLCATLFKSTVGVHPLGRFFFERFKGTLLQELIWSHGVHEAT